MRDDETSHPTKKYLRKRREETRKRVVLQTGFIYTINKAERSFRQNMRAFTGDCETQKFVEYSHNFMFRNHL